jgi:hypothetical protein
LRLPDVAAAGQWHCVFTSDGAQPVNARGTSIELSGRSSACFVFAEKLPDYCMES